MGKVLDKAASVLDGLRGEEAGSRLSTAIYVDEVTRALLDVRFEVTGHDGRWTLRGERELGGEARMLLGRPSPFVGRERELRNLLEIIEESVDEGRASVVLVTGPAGMGNSRLRYELLRKLQAMHSEVRVSIGRGDSIAGDITEATRLAGEAVALGRHGPRFFAGEAPVLLRHAVLLHEMGDHESARRVLSEARDELLSRAAKIPDASVRRSYLENIPDHRQTLWLARAWL